MTDSATANAASASAARPAWWCTKPSRDAHHQPAGTHVPTASSASSSIFASNRYRTCWPTAQPLSARAAAASPNASIRLKRSAATASLSTESSSPAPSVTQNAPTRLGQVTPFVVPIDVMRSRRRHSKPTCWSRSRSQRPAPSAPKPPTPWHSRSEAISAAFEMDCTAYALREPNNAMTAVNTITTRLAIRLVAFYCAPITCFSNNDMSEA